MDVRRKSADGTAAGRGQDRMNFHGGLVGAVVGGLLSAVIAGSAAASPDVKPAPAAGTKSAPTGGSESGPTADVGPAPAPGTQQAPSAGAESGPTAKAGPGPATGTKPEAATKAKSDTGFRFPNDFCPVEPHRKALDKFAITFRGKPIRFCCGNCVDVFRSDPEGFVPELAALPKDPDESAAAAGADGSPGSPGALAAELRREKRLDALVEWFAAGRPWFVCAFAALSLILVGRRVAGWEPTCRVGGLLKSATTPAGALVVGQALLIAWLTWSTSGLQPPPPRRTLPPGEEELPVKTLREMLAWAEDVDRSRFPQSTRVVFHRGNDERNRGLWNNGNYRTAEFHVALVDARGDDLRPGVAPAPGQMRFRLDIKRAPFTAPSFFRPAIVGKAWLYRLPTADLPLQEKPDPDGPFFAKPVEGTRGWRVEVPLPVTAAELAAGEIDRSGTMFLGMGTTARQYMPWRLRITGGKVTDESRVWMGSILRLGAIPVGEWLSPDPAKIPELPGPNATDPELLGLDESGDPVPARQTPLQVKSRPPDTPAGRSPPPLPESTPPPATGAGTGQVTGPGTDPAKAPGIRPLPGREGDPSPGPVRPVGD